MIHVDRNRVEKPAILESKWVNEANQDMKSYYHLDPEKRGQTRFSFERKVWFDTIPQLLDVFANKCAYCEQPLLTQKPLVNHHRPISDVIGLESKIFPDGYWWLAYDWDNLYLVCEGCASIKSTRFPVVGDNAAPEATGDDLRSERALLFDPCYDQPEQYFIYNHDGYISAVEPAGVQLKEMYAGFNRSEITIEILGLNRRDLVPLRREKAQILLKLWHQFIDGKSEDAKKILLELLEATSDQAPFAGMARNILVDQVKTILDAPGKLQPEVQEELYYLSEKLGLKQSPQMVSEPKKSFPPSLGKLARKPGVKTAVPHLGTKTAYIKRIEIKNFKAIRSLSLVIPEPLRTDIPFQSNMMVQEASIPDLLAPWKVLLGENGTGKSTVLQAVALALVGKFMAEQYHMRSEKILHRSADGLRAQNGYVRVWLSDQAKPVQVRFNNRGFQFYNQQASSSLYVRGYGATRLLPKGEDRPPVQVPPQMDVENLFNPFDPLFDAEKWLPELNEYIFDSIVLTYNDILGLVDTTVKGSISEPPMKPFQREGSQIYVTDPFGVRVTLDELSDGYQSVLALATDIIAGVQEQLTDFRNAAGIILIDEIGANLHPRWRMTFVKSLRNAFPRMQFLVTTHEPLCLRGLEDNEVAVMKRQDKQIIVLDENLPSPKRMRAGQLLTSRYFGLHSTIDPDIDKDFQTYYDLITRRINDTDDGLDPAQRVLLDDLKGKLINMGSMILGNTRRDQMVYELIDEYLAWESREGPQSKKVQELKETTKKKIFDIWSRARFSARLGLDQGEPGEI